MTEISGVKSSSATNNPFAEFNTQKNGYYFLPSYIATQNDSFQAQTVKKQEEKKERHLGKTIAFSALGVGAGILFLMRGLPKNAYKTLEKWSQKLENKIAKQRQNGQVGRFEEIYTFTLNKLNSFIGKAQSINNFVAVKDITFKKLMYKNKFTQKIHEKITGVYEKIGRRTVNKSYDKAKSKLYGMFQTFEDYDDRILKNSQNGTQIIEGKTVKDWLQEPEKNAIQRLKTV